MALVELDTGKKRPIRGHGCDIVRFRQKMRSSRFSQESYLQCFHKLRNKNKLAVQQRGRFGYSLPCLGCCLTKSTVNKLHNCSMMTVWCGSCAIRFWSAPLRRPFLNAADSKSVPKIIRPHDRKECRGPEIKVA